MSKLRTKQILDFATDVQSAMSSINATQNTAISANATAIANLDDTYATDTQLSDAVAVEKLRAEGEEGRLSAEIVAETERASAAEEVNAGKISDNKVAISANASAIASLDDIYATDTQLSDAVAVEKLRAEGEEGRLSAEILTEKGRLDAILLDSSEALDTFAEIKTFVDGLSADDIDIIGRVSDNENDISDNKVAISANASAIASLDDTYATDVELSDAVDVEKKRAEGVEGSLSAEIVAAEAAANGYTDGRETAITTAYVAADAVVLQSAKDYADGLVGGVDYAELEGTIVTATTFSTVGNFDQGLDAEVDVFINGLQIHRLGEGEVREGAEAGHGWVFNGAANQFEIVNLGYTLDEVDHIIVSGKVA
jgi:hypothetical protein